MPWRKVLAAALVLGAATGLSSSGLAADARVAASASAPSQGLPPGHPALDEGGDQEGLPAGHPQVGDAQPRKNAVPGMFEPPQDSVQEDSSLLPNSILVEVRDPDDKPAPHETVTLGIILQSVAKGDTRKHLTATTDDAGRVVFPGMDTGSGPSYRVSITKDGGQFAATPFGIPQSKAMHVVLHVYPVTRDIERTLVVMEGFFYAELKDDRLQVEEAFNIYNLGRMAWVPENLVTGLPSGFTALKAQEAMSDQSVTAVEEQGARLQGTFAPGKHLVEYRWQLPWSGDSKLDFTLGLPPHVARMSFTALASEDMKVNVEGFPAAHAGKDRLGEAILETERQVTQREAPLAKLHVVLEDLPTPGPGRIVATCVAGVGFLVGLGFVFAARKDPSGGASTSNKSLRQQLLAELEDLERSHRAGDVGPKTYERARRELIDAIARTLAAPEVSSS
jgi:hypothetical protein